MVELVAEGGEGLGAPWGGEAQRRKRPECRSGSGGRSGCGTASRLVRGLLCPDAAELSLDIAGAYRPEAGITEWHRTVRLDGADGGKVLVTEAWRLNHQSAGSCRT